MKKEHVWNTYLNPRNRCIQLQACSMCGIIKSPTTTKSACSDITERVSNMLEKRGWVILDQKKAA